MKNLKKIIVLFTILALAVSLVPMATMAEEAIALSHDGNATVTYEGTPAGGNYDGEGAIDGNLTEETYGDDVLLYSHDGLPRAYIVIDLKSECKIETIDIITRNAATDNILDVVVEASNNKNFDPLTYDVLGTASANAASTQETKTITVPTTGKVSTHTYRYVRVKAANNLNNKYGNLRLKEVIVKGTRTGNIAVDSIEDQAAVSYVGTPIADGYGAEKLVNDNTGDVTYLNAVDKNDPEKYASVTFDFGTARKFTGVDLVARNHSDYQAGSVNIQVANKEDFSDMVELFSGVTQTSQGATTSRTITDERKFRYLRIKKPDGGRLLWAEIMIYGDSEEVLYGNPIPADSISVKDYSGTFYNGNDMTNFGPQKLINGTISASNDIMYFSGNGWASFDLGRMYNLTRVDLFSRDHSSAPGFSNVNLYASKDNAIWVPIQTGITAQSGIRGQQVPVDFPMNADNNYRYLKVEINASNMLVAEIVPYELSESDSVGINLMKDAVVTRNDTTPIAEAYDADKIKDGEKYTNNGVYLSRKDGVNAEIYVDLGASYKLTRLDLVPRNTEGANSCTITVASDENYTQNVMTFDVPKLAGEDLFKKYINSDNTHRYIKITTTNQNLFFSELEVYGALEEMDSISSKVGCYVTNAVVDGNSASVTLSTTYPKKHIDVPQFILAAYKTSEDGSKKLVATSCNENAGRTTIVNGGDIDIDLSIATEEEYDEVKLMIMDSFDNLVPLCSAR